MTTPISHFAEHVDVSDEASQVETIQQLMDDDDKAVYHGPWSVIKKDETYVYAEDELIGTNIPAEEAVGNLHTFRMYDYWNPRRYDNMMTAGVGMRPHEAFENACESLNVNFNVGFDELPSFDPEEALMGSGFSNPCEFYVCVAHKKFDSLGHDVYPKH
jgi:hypothetical protein